MSFIAGRSIPSPAHRIRLSPSLPKSTEKLIGSDHSSPYLTHVIGQATACLPRFPLRRGRKGTVVIGDRDGLAYGETNP